MDLTIQLFDQGAWQDVAMFTGTHPEKGGVGGHSILLYANDIAFDVRNHSKLVSLKYPVTANFAELKSWPAFIYDLVPQGNGRKFLLGELKRNTDEGASADFDLLKCGAFNPIGRLRIKEAVEFYEAYEAYVDRHKNIKSTLSHGLTLADIVERSAQFVERMHIYGMLAAGTTGVQGAAPKFLLTKSEDGLWYADGQLTDMDAQTHWIIKLPRGKTSDDLKVLKNEAAYIKTANRMGLKTIEAIEFHGDKLFVQRFDRRKNSEYGVDRFHQESLASLAGIVGYNNGSQSQFDLLSALRSVSDQKKIDTIEFLKRDVLNLAMRNTDNHARNTAVQMIDGKVQLTPLYDFAPMFKDPEMVPRAARWYEPENGKELLSWNEIIPHLGLKDEERTDVVRNLVEFAEQLSQLPEIMLECGVDQDIVDLVKPSIENQREDLLTINDQSPTKVPAKTRKKHGPR